MNIIKSLLSTGSLLSIAAIAAGEALPRESDRAALGSPHMPSRLHAFVWQNWELVDPERIARTVNTSSDNIVEIARSMGLPNLPPRGELPLQRGYIGLIRQNWHLLPYEQLLKLLDWTPEQLAYTLREDDFLWTKLGSLKPKCPPLVYEPPDAAARKRAEEIKALVDKEFAAELAEPAQPRFQFIRDLSEPLQSDPPAGAAAAGEPIRFLYSYFAVYGDPLLKPELDPYPDGLLQRLAASGVNGVWLHTVLRQLAPGGIFPEFGSDHQTRLASLRRLVARAKRYGIRVYLYVNEPRAMPAEFFKGREHLRGVQQGEHWAMCTSAPQVRAWLSDSFAHVFRNVPDLGGVFTITASENFTNCASHYQQAKCPRCSKRSPAEIIADVNAAVAEGVWRGSPTARVLVWDWGWQDAWAEAAIRSLPQGVHLMSVSEWSLPITRGGVATAVGEYSLSAVGPGPRATRHWRIARERGLKTLAKVQVNCTWELSAMPYLPVMDLVARHCSNLTRAGVDGLMLSWTLGGYPSPNLQLAGEFFGSASPPSLEEALARVAEARYGKAAAPNVLAAWTAFSKAFEEFPYHGGVLYQGPMQMGPGNLLWLEPTGYTSSMVGFPYDHLDGWRAVYPAEVFASQLEKVAAGWEDGLALLKRAREGLAAGSERDRLDEDFRLAEAAGLHFRSAAAQSRFIIARGALKTAAGSERAQYLAAMRQATQSEAASARRLFTLARQDARIGYEATNHYYYTPLDLIEKVVNCEHALRQLEADASQ